MENINTLLAAVAQTQGFDDEESNVRATEIRLENSEYPTAVKDGLEDAHPSAMVDVPPLAPKLVFPGLGPIVTGEKRKRGRPYGQIVAKSPPPKRNKPEDEDEDVCFICFDGGSLVLCDRKRAVQRLIIRHVLSEIKPFSNQKLSGIADGTYVACVGRLHIICAILAPIHCARDVLRMQITHVSEETKDFARPA
ncbi:hypothetical protein CASFOL_027125 [Castilleja foliolosa]|uniref:Uncharacterized protein n=1 Tax=Castilleja foliolosa TaxID=1961234 RepID=A0ABD3CIG8_9LAMI